MSVKVLVLFCVISVSHTAKLPSYIQKCTLRSSNLTECLTKSTQDSWSQLYKGDKASRFPVADPLHISKMELDINGGLQINITNGDLLGLKNSQFNQVQLDLEKQTLDVDAYIPVCSYNGHYNVKGRILALPIIGDGQANITYVGGNYYFHMDFELKKDKKGNDHIVPKSNTLTYKVQRAYFQLENLFGNKQLSDNMNEILDENWEDVNKEIGAKVGDGLGEVLAVAIQSFFQKLSLKDMMNEYNITA